MKRNYFLLLLFMLSYSHHLLATELEISNVRGVNRESVKATPVSVIFDLKWKNSWKNAKNNDAVWVFMKFSGYWNNHVKLSAGGHKILQNRTGVADPIIEVSNDLLGFFIYPSKAYRGDIDLKMQILLDTTDQKIDRKRMSDLSVHGIEMVYIPQGAFTLGSPDKEGIKRASFYKSDAEGKSKGLVRISSEAAVKVAPEDDALYYWSENALYNGDQKGPIPTDFPKGYDAFYIMKYELTQGQYAAFLNTLPTNWTYLRSPIAGRDYYSKRGGIRLKEGKYVADNPHRPMNYVSFTDGLAYSDWAAIRPITELEYEKAARGSSVPIPYEFVWGTGNYDLLERYVGADAEVAMTNGHQEQELSDKTKPIFGASYFWVMDLSGSLWEKVITVGNEVGRKFKGSHGDGKLDFGHATNEDWPKSDDEVGGFGYRGGGYYEVGMIYGDFNPHSPIGYRYYGAWSGGPRYLSYGYRGGRSSE